MVHKTIKTPRGTIHYWVKGSSGQAMAFSHGATMDHGMFHHQGNTSLRRIKLSPGMRHPHRYLSRVIAKGIALDIQVQTYALDVLQSYITAEIVAIMDGVYRGSVMYYPDILSMITQWTPQTEDHGSCSGASACRAVGNCG